mmetsp:Transcript_37351/g.45537  ORF Transcript_37351/g.45537 Transcript_37351/m.45537 type:complete len:146 (-) Transcript_37351:12-449(-)
MRRNSASLRDERERALGKEALSLASPASPHGSKAGPALSTRKSTSPITSDWINIVLHLIDAVGLLPTRLDFSLQGIDHLLGPFRVLHRFRIFAVPERHTREVIVDHALHLRELAALFLRARRGKVEVRNTLALALAHVACLVGDW